jgi:rod shape-determining protein MreB
MFGARGVGIDLGTANVLVYVKGKGIVIREPTVVAVERKTGQLLAIGEEARRMIGKTPGNIIARQPLKDGVIAEYAVTLAMLKYFLRKACGRWQLIKPDVVVSVPSNVNSVERRAVIEAAKEAGARRAFTIEEPMAAAIGAGLPISEPGGCMVVDIGGGTTDIAVISLGGIVVSDCVRVGGVKMDEAIARYIRREYNLMIGEQTAEQIKIRIGSAYKLPTEMTMEIKGRDMVAGLPKVIKITSEEIRNALAEPVSQIVERVKSVLERTPPELAADIITRGITLTGGGALLKGIDKLLQLETGIPVHVADDPLSCVGIGTGLALDMLHVLRCD